MVRKENFRVDALLIGYENKENLGLRSVMAYLQESGYNIVLVPFFPGNDESILEAVRAHNPRLVGFSVIFQFTLEEFGQLMQGLRTKGVKAHFTAGGHFPSLRPELTMQLIPELDSVVRFEGELTLFELLEHLDQPQHWEQIQSLAYRKGSEIKLTQLRPLVSNLDSLPSVYRDEPQEAGLGVKMASMLASRGCLYNCSFCSIRQFYGSVPGALRRVRSPQSVVDEMLALFTDKGVRYFSFQDDDFAAKTKQQRQWLHFFLEGLSKTGLAKCIRWKISCRVDDLEPEILKEMMDHGLMAVYLGVESGSEAGLRTLNKKVSVAQNLEAINLLKYNNMAMAMGFMLFDPSSTTNTICENLDFLIAVGEDGYFPVNFCKMLPYAGTPIESELRKAGRLKGDVIQPDYNFLDERLDWYEALTKLIFTRRNFGPDGTVVLLQAADFQYRLAQSFGFKEPTEAQEKILRNLISKSNKVTLQTLRELLYGVISQDIKYLLEEQDTIMEIAERQWRSEMEIEVELKSQFMEALPLLNNLPNPHLPQSKDSYMPFKGSGVQIPSA
jgi:anaerobic magnesium-protoporphyrin IX monomethyl ester cyclase